MPDRNLIRPDTELSPDRLLRLVDSAASLEAAPELRRTIVENRKVVESCLRESIPVYGLNTGLGALVGSEAELSDIHARQCQIITGRACGTGSPLSPDTSRAALQLLLHFLARGVSGVHPDTFDFLLNFHNAGLVPVIPSIGSIGAGDLVANAHMALPLIGLGEIWVGDTSEPSGPVLQRHGLPRCRLHAHDAMGLINHGAVSIANAATAIALARECFQESVLACAMAFEGFAANRNIFDPRINTLRPARGQLPAARWFHSALSGSLAPERRIQDPLSFRLAAVIFGEANHALNEAGSAVRVELNAAPASPAVLSARAAMRSTPNFFHPAVTNSLQQSVIALFNSARASVQRCQRLMQPEVSELPRCLSPVGGVSAGMIPLQKTANALLAEMAYSAQSMVPPLPAVSESVEDFESPGLQAGLRLRDMLRNYRQLNGIEAMVAAQAMDLRDCENYSPLALFLHRRLRGTVPFLTEDRSMAPDIREAAAAMHSIGRDLDQGKDFPSVKPTA
ncbi:MAG: aromatic amino acid lyase [Rhodobacteraceae bacterium]|nr:aromatic amino acid lyase [Paracoccaceae bacterium]